MTLYQQTIERLKSTGHVPDYEEIKNLFMTVVAKFGSLPVEVRIAAFSDALVDIMCAVHEAGGDVLLFKKAKDEVLTEWLKEIGTQDMVDVFNQSR